MTTLTDFTTLTASDLDRVITVFDEELSSDVDAVSALVEQVKRYRGKLLRPRLVLLSGRAAGSLRREHVVLAAVVEMVHMATLVHDDVLDEAEVRRRGPTVHCLAGNEGAVLLGDYLISHAYHLCSSLGSTHASRRIADATNTVCEGELMQIARRGDRDITEEQYLDIIRRKTAVLTGVCCELGAWASEAPKPVIEHLGAFGVDLGMAFQIVDDLLDLTASEDEAGKSVGRDADLEKWTLPMIRLRDSTSPADRARLFDLTSRHRGDMSAQLREMCLSSGAIESAMQTARAFIESAMVHLAELPTSEARDALAAAAEFSIARRM